MYFNRRGTFQQVLWLLLKNLVVEMELKHLQDTFCKWSVIKNQRAGTISEQQHNVVLKPCGDVCGAN